MRYSLFIQNGHKSHKGIWSVFPNACFYYDRQRGGIVSQSNNLFVVEPVFLEGDIYVGKKGIDNYVAIPESHPAYNMILFSPISKINSEPLSNRIWKFLTITLNRLHH